MADRVAAAIVCGTVTKPTILPNKASIFTAELAYMLFYHTISQLFQDVLATALFVILSVIFICYHSCISCALLTCSLNKDDDDGDDVIGKVRAY